MRIPCGTDEDEASARARFLTRPTVLAASAITLFEGDNHDINALISELETQAARVHTGDMSRAESMLIAQSHTLDELFNALLRRSCANFNGGYLDAGERYMRLALKAQSQCRTTLETLAEIKNPCPVAFVKQANIAHGPQQVNNGALAPTRAGELANQANELKEIGPNEPKAIGMDAGAQSAPGGADSDLAPVGAINRPEDESR